MAFETAHTCWPAVSPWEMIQAKIGPALRLSSNEFIVTSLETKKIEVTINGVAGARGAAVHPSGKFLLLDCKVNFDIIYLPNEQIGKKSFDLTEKWKK